MKHFMQNKVVQRLSNSKSYQHHIIRSNISWGSDISEIRQVYKNFLKQDEAFLALLTAGTDLSKMTLRS